LLLIGVLERRHLRRQARRRTLLPQECAFAVQAAREGAHGYECHDCCYYGSGLVAHANMRSEALLL
jgi:hypothetical protein